MPYTVGIALFVPYLVAYFFENKVAPHPASRDLPPRRSKFDFFSILELLSSFRRSSLVVPFGGNVTNEVSDKGA